jgi:hypothetical protein
VKGIGAAGRLKLSIGGYGSRLKAGTTEVSFLTAVIVRLDRTIQYAAAFRFIIGVSGILDHPVEPGDDEESVWHDPSAVIASEAKQSILQVGEAKDGLLRRKCSSQ